MDNSYLNTTLHKSTYLRLMNEFLTDLHEIITTHHVDVATADTVIAIIRKRYGGCPVYIEKTDRKYISERNAEIYRQFNGKNTRTLCMQFGLCYQQIYKIVAEERKDRNHESQKIFNLKA